jgi:hypothetical protein
LIEKVWEERSLIGSDARVAVKEIIFVQVRVNRYFIVEEGISGVNKAAAFFGYLAVNNRLIFWTEIFSPRFSCQLKVAQIIDFIILLIRIIKCLVRYPHFGCRASQLCWGLFIYCG